MKNNLIKEAALLHKRQKEFFASRITLPNAFRIKKLKELQKEINSREAEIHDALYQDIRKSPFESMTSETVLVLKEISLMIKMLPLWNRPHRAKSSLINFPSKDYITPEPFGNTLMISPWNYPFQLAITPLIGAVAAGNTVVLKPSEFAPHTAAIIKKIIKNVFDPGHVSVIEGDATVATELLKKRWDYIMFTGSTRVGKIVAQAAAVHLTPTTLELGGKSPCIVDDSAPIGITAKRIVWGKFLNCGQTCIAPDYLLVHKKAKSKLVAALIKEIERAFGNDQKASDDYGRIAHLRHFKNLKASLEDQKILSSLQIVRHNLVL